MAQDAAHQAETADQHRPARGLRHRTRLGERHVSMPSTPVKLWLPMEKVMVSLIAVKSMVTGMKSITPSP